MLFHQFTIKSDVPFHTWYEIACHCNSMTNIIKASRHCLKEMEVKNPSKSLKFRSAGNSVGYTQLFIHLYSCISIKYITKFQSIVIFKRNGTYIFWMCIYFSACFLSVLLSSLIKTISCHIKFNVLMQLLFDKTYMKRITLCYETQ